MLDWNQNLMSSSIFVFRCFFDSFLAFQKKCQNQDCGCNFSNLNIFTIWLYMKSGSKKSESKVFRPKMLIFEIFCEISGEFIDFLNFRETLLYFRSDPRIISRVMWKLASVVFLRRLRRLCLFILWCFVLCLRWCFFLWLRCVRKLVTLSW